MAITKVNNYSISDSNLSASYETLDKTRKGLNDISLSNFENDSAPVVEIGSIFENLGSMYKIETATETPTGYGSVSNSAKFFLYYDSSAGSFIYLSTAPTWNAQYQGWYNGDDRALFGMYKDSGGTLYQGKYLMVSKSLANTGVFPIGSTYMQFPTKENPIELGFFGTWENISDEFPGDFFRAEGGNASSFESGQQTELIKNHTHPLFDGTGSGSSQKSVTTALSDASALTGNNTGGGAETRPVNRTVRIWERTA